MKTCTQCNKPKDESLFYFSKRLNRFLAECKDCEKLRKSKRYHKNKQKYSATAKKYRMTNHGRYIKLINDSKYRKILVLITETQFEELIKNPCYYCSNNLGTPSLTGTGLDRLDSSKHYELDNIVSCCHFCNTIKNYLLTASEMKTIADLLINERKGLPPVDSLQIKEGIRKSQN